MTLSTKQTLAGKIADTFGLNKTFHRYKEIDINPNDTALISPVEGKVVHLGNINKEGVLISKHNNEVQLDELIGSFSKCFIEGKYINFYLSPSSLHFWITPCNGMFTYTQKNEGKSIIPIFIGLEYLFGIEMFGKATKKNATVGFVLQTREFPVAMIAIGSLNVNRIHTDYEERRNYKKGTPCGYFSIGSSMLLCYPNHLKVLIEQGSEVKIGQRILI